jgi:HSP20 family protein
MLTKWSDFGFSDMDRTFSALSELRREMDRVFSDFDQGFGLGRSLGLNAGPRTNLFDTGSALVLKAEVPGVDEKDLNISVDQGTLTIRGERKDEVPEGYAVHRKEHGAFKFSRAFTLPCKVETEKVKASLKNGILELTLPKAPEAQPRQIEVSVN